MTPGETTTLEERPTAATSSAQPEQMLRPLGASSEELGTATGYCQRCTAGLVRPEMELKRCPGCARDVCASCRKFEPQIEAHVCLDCAGFRDAKRKARRRSGMHLARLGASILAIAAGSFVALRVAWTWLLLAGVALVVGGIVTFAWQLVCRRACPICEGEVKARRRKGHPLEYECRVCRHVWVE